MAKLLSGSSDMTKLEQIVARDFARARLNEEEQANTIVRASYSDALEMWTVMLTERATKQSLCYLMQVTSDDDEFVFYCDEIEETVRFAFSDDYLNTGE